MAIVAVTRPLPQAAGTAARLVRRGHTPFQAPVLTIVPLGPPGEPPRQGTAVLTSRTAAQLLAGQSGWHHLPVVAVGDATAAQARRAGFAVVTSAAGAVDALPAALADHPDPIVHLCGEDHRGDLVERLQAAGRTACRRIVYRMAPADALPAPPDGLGATLLYSPRTAAVFRRLADARWLSAPVVALSQAVADAAGGARRVAERPDESALFNALEAALATAPATR